MMTDIVTEAETQLSLIESHFTTEVTGVVGAGVPIVFKIVRWG